MWFRMPGYHAILAVTECRSQGQGYLQCDERGTRVHWAADLGLRDAETLVGNTCACKE